MTDGSPLAPDAVAAAAAETAAGPDRPVFAPGEDAVVRRTRNGWRVGGEDVPDLTCAMVLADLLAADLPAAGQLAAPAGDQAPAGQEGASEAAGTSARPAKTPKAAPAGPRAGAAGDAGQPASDGESSIVSEARRLKATVSQLQYALTARIRVEQAIGVLAERHRIQPRQAFEQLRAAARARGQKVIDIAADVVASATNPLLQLPDELSRPRSARRRSVGQPHGAA
jgi:ANTAR domain